MKNYLVINKDKIVFILEIADDEDISDSINKFKTISSFEFDTVVEDFSKSYLAGDTYNSIEYYKRNEKYMVQLGWIREKIPSEFLPKMEKII